MAIVSIAEADRYDAALVYAAVCKHFEALNIAQELHPGTRVLIKPNMLLAKKPAAAATTHPVFLRAVAKRLRELNIKNITLADSSGGLYTERTLRKTYDACGFSSLSDLLTLNSDTSSEKKNGFQIITPVLEADYIINCAKLKTHALMVMTAAVKNMFGSVPGIKKAEYHCVKSTVEPFTKMILDLHETVKPQLNLVDAIDCMEGNGPSGGNVRHMGYTLASKCAYATDEVCAELMAVNPSMVRTVHWARKRGLVDPGAIRKTGDTLTPADPGFALPDSIIQTESDAVLRWVQARDMGENIHQAGRKPRQNASAAANAWKDVRSILSRWKTISPSFQGRDASRVFAATNCAPKRRLTSSGDSCNFPAKKEETASEMTNYIHINTHVVCTADTEKNVGGNPMKKYVCTVCGFVYDGSRGRSGKRRRCRHQMGGRSRRLGFAPSAAQARMISNSKHKHDTPL